MLFLKKLGKNKSLYLNKELLCSFKICKFILHNFIVKIQGIYSIESLLYRLVRMCQNFPATDDSFSDSNVRLIKYG